MLVVKEGMPFSSERSHVCVIVGYCLPDKMSNFQNAFPFLPCPSFLFSDGGQVVLLALVTHRKSQLDRCNTGIGIVDTEQYFTLAIVIDFYCLLDK